MNPAPSLKPRWNRKALYSFIFLITSFLFFGSQALFESVITLLMRIVGPVADPIVVGIIVVGMFGSLALSIILGVPAVKQKQCRGRWLAIISLTIAVPMALFWLFVFLILP